MKAIATNATVNDSGQLILDDPLSPDASRRVRVIVLIPEDHESDSESEDGETSDEVALEGIRQGLYEAFTRQTILLSQMWEGVDIWESVDAD
jgi:hypothetical protein